MSPAGVLHLACGDAAALLVQAPAPQRWLSAGESRRLAGLRTPRRRESFLAARWQARWLLAQAFGGDPAGWVLEAPDDAPPRVAQRPDLFLSVSHSGGVVASALAQQPVGVDVEVPRAGRDIAGLVDLCCTPTERVLFERVPPADAAALFHELWTVKEAWLKRRGDWLAPSRLQQLEAAPHGRGEVRVWRQQAWQLAACIGADAAIRWWTPEPTQARRWAVQADEGRATTA